MKMNFGRDSN